MNPELKRAVLLTTKYLDGWEDYCAVRFTWNEVNNLSLLAKGSEREELIELRSQLTSRCAERQVDVIAALFEMFEEAGGMDALMREECV